MNVHMYDHPAVQANLQVLAERGVRSWSRARASWRAATSAKAGWPEPGG